MRKTVETSKVHRLFYPVVPVLITASLKDTVACMPAISCTALSFKPLLIGVAIAPEHHTHNVVKGSGYFVVNWVEYPHAEKIAHVAEVSGRVVRDKITAAGFHITEGRASPAPVIEEAAAAVECAVRQIHTVGDHDLFIGECLAAYAAEDFVDYWMFRAYRPVLYVGSESTVYGERYVTLKAPTGESRRLESE